MQRPYTAGAYLTGPALLNPASMYAYSAAPAPRKTRSSFASPANTTAIDEEAVQQAIERLTTSPKHDPAALQQAALDMELVVSYFDALSEDFGPEAALTSFALDLAKKSADSDQRQTGGKTRIIRASRQRYSKN